MKIKAAVLVETGYPLEILELDVPALKKNQVLVKMHYSGICRTQYMEIKGLKGKDKYLPHCLGHEGSAEVIEIGPDVKNLKIGDKVVLTWIKNNQPDAGGCIYNSSAVNSAVNAGAVTTFMDYAVVSVNRINKIRPDYDLRIASLLGCAASTGIGIVKNTVEMSKDSKIIIFGVGGIGLFSLQAAHHYGCRYIVAADICEKKLGIAKKFGASELVNMNENCIVEGKLKDFDFAIETSGQISNVRHSMNMLKPQGGKCIVASNYPYGKEISIDPYWLNQGKSIIGTWGGETVPERDLSEYCEIINDKKADLALFFDRTYKLEDINQAISDYENGLLLRPVITFN